MNREPATAAPLGRPELSIVCPHFEEDLSWVPGILDAFPSVRIYLFDCGVSPVAECIKTHSRVTVHRKKPDTTLFWVYFEYCSRYYDRLGEYVLFCHGHDTAWHQRLTLEDTLELIHACMPFEFINASDRVYEDWLNENSEFFKWGRDLWQNELQPILDGPDFGTRLVEINAGQVCVNRAAILSRQRKTWRQLAECAAQYTHHGREDHAFEACLHGIMGQPWERPFILEHLERLRRFEWRSQPWRFLKQALKPRANELILRAGNEPIP